MGRVVDWVRTLQIPEELREQYGYLEITDEMRAGFLGKNLARLAKIDQKSLRTAKAYQMRLVLQDIYRSANATEARQRFRVWCRWVRWVARQQPKNLMRSMLKVAALVENHLAGIVAHWKWGVTNAFMEGLNSVFSATKRKARGYRSTIHLIAILYFVAGKLRLPQF